MWRLGEVEFKVNLGYLVRGPQNETTPPPDKQITKNPTEYIYTKQTDKKPRGMVQL